MPEIPAGDRNYYNEHDNKAADWLESLIERGLIPAGTVDRRSIEDVLPSELAGYTQCHFFAGIGGWSYALQLAGWPAERKCWTGSAPCQPFSSAGRGGGTADERHLWPAFHWLISQCRPEYVFGEQVAGKAGESWFDIVSTDLAAEDYTSGLAVLPACSVGAPHIRKRLFWVANASGKDSGRNTGAIFEQKAKSNSERREAGRVVDRAQHGGPDGRLANADNAGLPQRESIRGVAGAAPGRPERQVVADDSNALPYGSETNGFWRDADWLGCRDAKWRPIEPGLKPLANGLPDRVAQLRGYGNAIVPQVAAEFVRACCARDTCQ